MEAETNLSKFDRLEYCQVQGAGESFLVNKTTVLAKAEVGLLHQLFDPRFIKDRALSWTAKGGRGQTLIFELDYQRLVGAADVAVAPPVAESSVVASTPVVVSSRGGESTLHWCYRQYLRGGLIGKVIKRSFLRTGAHAHRAADEFKMLMKMRLLGLPVPRPVAACERVGLLTIKNEIIIEEIQGTWNLAEILGERGLREEEIRSIGGTLYQFFKFNIVHTDLNLRNILMDSNGNCYVIDFDKCRFGGNVYESVIQVQQMLDRLERSFNKAMELGHIQHYEAGVMAKVRRVVFEGLAKFNESGEEGLEVDLAVKPEEALPKLDVETVKAIVQSE